MLAYQISNKIKAGLFMVGQEKDGSIKWVGSKECWDRAENFDKFRELQNY